MIFKKHWKIIVAVIIIVGLFTATAIVQSRIPSDIYDETYASPMIDDSEEFVSPTILVEKPKYITLPVVPTPVIEESSDNVVEEPQTSGYQISYVSEEFDKHLLQVMKDFNINLDASYVYATIFCESTFRNAVESSSGAIGYMQVLPSTRDYIAPMIKSEFPQYSDLSRDLSNPYTNVVYGLYYFSHIAKSFGDTEVNEDNICKILTCYNRGITGGKRYFNYNGHWNSDYARKIVRTSEQIRANGGM